MAIITTTDLAPWVRPSKEELDEHVLAMPVIEQASLLVNEAVWKAAEADYWLLPDKPPPQTARDIAVQLAARVFSNPRVVQQRSTGPMSERIADVVLTGMALRPDEIERLQMFVTDGSNSDGGLWVLETGPNPADAVLEPQPYVEAYQTHPVSLIGPTWEYPYA